MTDNILYDHYKDSCSQLNRHIVKRDRLTILLLLTVVFFTFLLSSPLSLTDAVNQYLMSNSNVNAAILDFSMLHTGVIYLLLWFLLQYYQVCLTIEKDYAYLWKLEEELTNNGLLVSREGVGYATSYPLLKNVTNFLYTWVLPIGIGFLSSVRICKECAVLSMNVTLDCIGLGLIVLLSLLYISDRNLNWQIWSSDHSLWDKLKGFVKLDLEQRSLATSDSGNSQEALPESEADC